MQMSIERFQEVHKLIWNTVIENFSERGEKFMYFLKIKGIEVAYKKGILAFDEAFCCLHNNNCLLCAACTRCEQCPIKSCNYEGSLYSRACEGDVEAMIEIRDIVDKPPFSELSIVTLYDLGDE